VTLRNTTVADNSDGNVEILSHGVTLVLRNTIVAVPDHDGLWKVVLKGGSAVGKARITVTGKGARLQVPPQPLPLPLTLPVRVQLTRDLTTRCWDATFTTSSRNTDTTFTARSDP